MAVQRICVVQFFRPTAEHRVIVDFISGDIGDFEHSEIVLRCAELIRQPGVTSIYS